MNKTYVIGFDGATWRFIEPLVRRGEMPNFQRLMERGASGNLTSTVPFQSAAAWVTFMTGKNPGEHGVYMFQDYDATSYSYVGRTANARYFAGQTIFDIIGQSGRKVTAIRVPMTYPAWPINGLMVSGFPTPGDTPDSFFPTSLRNELGSDAQPEISDFRDLTTDQQAETLEQQMNRLGALVNTMLDREHDFFMVVHRISDEIHHFFIGFVDDRTPAYDAEQARLHGDLVNHFYRKMDETLGETLQRLDADDTIFVISDHGGNITPPRHVNLNVWLAQQGLLTPQEQTQNPIERLYALNQSLIPARIRSLLRSRAPKNVQGGLKQMWRGLQKIDFSKTQAYHFPMKCPPLLGIVINVRGRQAEGVVQPEQYEALRDQIMTEVKRLRDPNTNQPIVRAVYKREDLYHGPFIERAPDIIVWCDEMYKEGRFAQGPLVSEAPFDELQQVPGAHDENGIFLAMGPGIRPGAEVTGANLIDIPPTVLHAMGLSVPTDMDGRVLTEIFSEGGRAVESVDMQLERQSEESYLSEDEEALIKDKLKGWGYL